jgi:hypothetical protein
VAVDTNRPIIIYISAASDLMAEREALARMIATLPVTLPWRVMQTPVGEELLDVAALSAADFHILVMGGDIRAPVGSEWHTIRRYNRPSVAFLKKDVTQTPAGHVFVRQAEVAWRPFIDATDLSRQARQMLAEYLIQNAIRYALTLPEVEQLEALQQADTASEQPVEGQGAGRSAVVLSRERYTPSEGVIVDE